MGIFSKRRGAAENSPESEAPNVAESAAGDMGVKPVDAGAATTGAAHASDAGATIAGSDEPVAPDAAVDPSAFGPATGAPTTAGATAPQPVVPAADLTGAVASASPFSRKASRKARRAQKRLDKLERRRGVVRIDELERALETDGAGDLDPDKIVSMYLPRRQMHRLGSALLHLGTMQKALIVLILLFCTVFAFAFMQENMGNFTINLNRLELFRYGVAIADEPEFKDATARLYAEPIPNGTNIAAEDLPADLDQVDGSHNGRNYVAYTFYIRNAGKTDLDYRAQVRLASASKSAEKAARVKVWKNGEPTLYAAAAADGEPEKDCTNFESDTVVCTYDEENFLVGNVDKYTVVVWLDGDDPECTDDIVGGAVEFTMDFDTLDKDNSSLIVKFLRDIADTITGTDPISSAGNVAPDYYKNHTVTWENRRNQENSPVSE